MEKEKQRALSLATEQLKERFGKTLNLTTLTWNRYSRSTRHQVTLKI